jgi:acyl-CoA thioester hydrolase
MKTFSTRSRVRYAETDASGIVYYNSYFVYFELGRVELFRALDLPYDWRVPIAETYCRYHASARFDDELEIRTSLQQVRSKGFRLGCEVYRLPPADSADEPALLVEGYTAMVTLDDDGETVELPSAFRAAFDAMS